MGVPLTLKSLESIHQIFDTQFRDRTPKSKLLYDEAKNHLPGGVSGSAKFMKPYPVYISRSGGAKIVDVDGNEYIDTLMGAGVNIIGHNPKPILDSIRRQLDIIVNPLLATELEVTFAKKIKTHMPHLERVRFVNTGTEATFFALRAARAFTGKNKIAKFEGNYHGQFDYTMISAMSGAFGPETQPQAEPDCAGISKQALDSAVILPYNNAEAAVSIIKQNAADLAAVILEPVAMFQCGTVPADKEFIKMVREVTAEEGIPLIFDEIVTGFRLGLGGASQYYDTIPDLTAFGKIAGGGLAMGGYGGRADIMEKVVTPTKEPSDIKEKIFQSGTFSANPLSMTAGIAMLEQLEKGGVYPYIDALGGKLRVGLEKIANNRKVSMQINGLASMFQIHFSELPIRNRRDMAKANSKLGYIFALGMIAGGIFLAPAHPGFLSTAHTEADIDRILGRADEVLGVMAAAS